MNIKQKISEIEKGCGKEIYIGKFMPNEICGLGMLCPDCRKEKKLEFWKRIHTHNNIEFVKLDTAEEKIIEAQKEINYLKNTQKTMQENINHLALKLDEAQKETAEKVQKIIEQFSILEAYDGITISKIIREIFGDTK